MAKPPQRIRKMSRPRWAARLALIRELSGLSQAKFAATIGVTTEAYQLYEYGKRELRFETLRRIRDVYRISLDVLICDINEWEISSLAQDFDPLTAPPDEQRRYLAIVSKPIEQPKAFGSQQTQLRQPRLGSARNQTKSRRLE